MMNKLQQYFPMIRTREEVLDEIENRRKLNDIFYGWKQDDRKEFIFREKEVHAILPIYCYDNIKE